MRLVEWLERHQIALYLGALAFGALTGFAFPFVAGPAEHAITPVLGLLLYATFLGIPFRRFGRAVRDGRFIAAVLVLNFVVVPAVVWTLTRFIAADEVLLVAILFVLLAPCVDYVIVFTGLAGGASDRLVATTPLLMLGQMALIPVYLWLFAGSDALGAFDLAPFAHAFLWLIVGPMLAAAATQRLAGRFGWAARLRDTALAAMVPLMMVTLACVVASQVGGVGALGVELALSALIFAAFAVIMVPVGMLIGAAVRLDEPGRRAVVFSGVTRNSLVVLPLVIALPAAYDRAPLIVVTQTLVELIVMVVLVAVLPRRDRARSVRLAG